MNAFDPAALECLAALADAGSFERAAQRLSITQSAVSQRLRALETGLGRLLVVRSRPLRLTEPGKVLLRYARQMQAMRADLSRELGTTLGQDERLPIAVNADSLATWVLPALDEVVRDGQREGYGLELVVDDQDFTNYLDIEGAIWLKAHLKRYPHTLLVVSHDKDFLDEVCDHILHLDRGKMTLYRGNYANFARQRAEKAMLAEKEADKLAAQRAHLQAFIDRFKAKASKAKQAQSRVKQLEKLGPVATFSAEEAARLHLPNPEKPLAPPIVAMEGASVGYGERVVLRNLNLFISDDDRIGLLGQNGNGKSTLVKLIAGRLDAMAGTVTRAAKLNVAYFAQHQLDELSESDTPYLLVRRRMPQAGEAQVRAKTAQLGFGVDKADTAIARLSGGEKARLLLGLAAFDGPHLLILDEPTNRLDIPMREALVEALADYKGAVIIVSHDRAILDASCDRLWLVADGGVKTFDGDLDDYEAMVVSARGSETGKRESAGNGAAPSARREAAEKRANLKPLRERAKALENQLEKFNTLLARADEALANPDTFAKSPERAAQIAKDRAALAERIAETEEEWLTVMGELEGA